MSAPALAETIPAEEVAKHDAAETDKPVESEAPTDATVTTAEIPSATESTATDSTPASAPAPAAQASPEPTTSPEPPATTEPVPPPRQREMVADARLGVLRGMFPDFDDSLLQSVLDSVDGNTDRAIDALLGMSDPDFVSEHPTAPEPQAPRAQTQEEMDEQLARTLAMEDEQMRASAWPPQNFPQQQQRQQRPQAQRRASEGPEKDTMQELTEQFNKIAESGKRTIGTLFSKVKAKIQEMDQPSGSQAPNMSYSAGGGNAAYAYEGDRQPPPAAGRHAQQAYYQQQQAQEQAQMPAYYDPNVGSNTTPPSSATAVGYDAAPSSRTAPAGVTGTPSPPTTNSGAPQIDGGKLGMLPKRPVSLLRTNSPPATSGGAPPSSDDDDELEYAENPFDEGKK